MTVIYGTTITVPTIVGTHTGYVAQIKTGDVPALMLNGANQIDSGGGNLQAYTDATRTTRLGVDIVECVTGGTPSFLAYVRMPSAATGQTIYLATDDAQTVQPIPSALYGSEEVWQDYSAVYKLANGNDSSGNGYTLTSVGTPTFGVTDPFGSVSAVDLNGTTDWLKNNSWLNWGAAAAVSLWVKTDSPSTTQTVFSQNTSETGGATWDSLLIRNSVDWEVNRAVSGVNGGTPSTSWKLIHINFGSSTSEVFENGVSVGTNSQAYISGTKLTLYLGALARSGTQLPLNGALSLFKVHTSTSKNADYISTEYSNQSSSTWFSNDGWNAVGGSSNLNTSHFLYPNLTRALRSDTVRSRLLDQTGGTDHTAEQTTHNVFAQAHVSGVAPTQGMATDGVYWYEINTTGLEKRDFTTGALITSNNSPFTGLPSGVDHLGDGFVDGGLLYVPITDYDSATQTATKQTIGVFNTSDLSLNTSFDVSAQTAFNGSGLTKSHTGTIYGTSFYKLSAPNAAQTEIYEFNLTTGAFIQVLSLSVASIGSQGITWDGESYLVSSWDTINNKNRIKQYDSSLTFIDDLDPTGLDEPSGGVEIEGIEYFNGIWYVHALNTAIRYFDKKALYINPTSGVAVQFLTQAQIPEEATIVMRMNPHTFLDYRTVFDNKDTANDWEAWIYATGELAWRVSSTARTGYNYAGGANVEHLFMFSWKRNGANVDIKLGVDGAIVSTQTSVWVNMPAQGLWLGGGNPGNTKADHTYHDVVLYNKELTVGDWATLGGDFDDIYASGGFTLDIDGGAYTSTGGGVDLLFNRSLSVNGGSYLTSGASINLLFNRSINTDGGIYNTTGSPLDLLFNRQLLVDGGSYTYTGSAVTLVYNPLTGFVMGIDGGTYNITGSPVDTLYNRVVDVDGGSYSTSGANLALLYNRSLNIDGGVYSVSGGELSLLLDRVIQVDGGNYSYTGGDVGLIYSGQITLLIDCYSVEFKQDGVSISYAEDNARVDYGCLQ